MTCGSLDPLDSVSLIKDLMNTISDDEGLWISFDRHSCRLCWKKPYSRRKWHHLAVSSSDFTAFVTSLFFSLVVTVLTIAKLIWVFHFQQIRDEVGRCKPVYDAFTAIAEAFCTSTTPPLVRRFVTNWNYSTQTRYDFGPLSNLGPPGNSWRNCAELWNYQA